ncbi:MAG TPA: ABC transporter permease [Acidimicrobiia bacterium]|nr:ABC transporter permease [Acidimicrobiia bacterium]
MDTETGDVVSFFNDLIGFFTSVDSWSGQDGILVRTFDHIRISAFAVAVAVILALPVAVWLGHHGRGAYLAISLANIGRAVPSFGIVALAFPIALRLGLGISSWPTFVALVALAIPPIFTNGYTAVREVSPAAVEASVGMGMTDLEVLTQTELPLGMPVIWTAIRVSAVQVVATATLGAVVGWGGLGRYVIDGFAQGDDVSVFAGALLVAALSLFTDQAFAAAERWVLPRGVSARDLSGVELGAHG